MFGSYGRGTRMRGPTTFRKCSIESLENRIALSGTPPKVMEVAVASTDWSSAYVAHLNPNQGGIGGYSIPVGSSAQSTALPWNNIDQVKIRFSEDVHIQAADLALTGKNVTSYAFESFFYDPQKRIATWTLASPIGKDRLLLDLDANGIDPVTDLDGNVLDGEWTNNSSSFASGNNTAGGDFEFLFNVLPGEVNSTTQVTSLDYVLARNQEGKSTTSSGYNFKCDVDGSGAVEATDWQFVQSKIGNTLPTGSPAGTGNDAPTHLAFLGQSMSAAASKSISLWSNFGDAENGASGLTYSIVSVSSPALFTALSVNQSTGQLSVTSAYGVSGRSSIGVAATDSGGISTTSTVSVDVDYNNQPPWIVEAYPSYQGSGTWRFTGVVYDDEDVTGLIVTFYGVFSTRTAVYPDGTFEFDIILGDGPYDDEYAQTADRQGLVSNLVLVPVGFG